VGALYLGCGRESQLADSHPVTGQSDLMAEWPAGSRCCNRQPGVTVTAEWLSPTAVSPTDADSTCSISK
jgi:hypothetical protein